MPPSTNDPLSRLIRANASARVAIARRPHLYWIAVAAVALAVAVSVRHQLQRVDAARDAWGTPHRVLVATRAVEPGEALTAAVAERTLPGAAVPASAIDSVEPGAVAQHPLGAGEVLLAHHVAPGTGLAGRLPAGTAGVAVAGVNAALPLALGDIVDVVAIDDPLGGTAGAAGTVLATGSTVVALTDGGAVLAIPTDAAPTSAAALAGGRAVLVLARSVGPPTP